MTKYTNGTRKEELEKLVNAHKKLRNVTYGLIALLVVALIAAILKMMIPSIACLAVMALLRFTVHRSAREEYRQTMTDAALTCSVGAKLDEFELKEKGGTGITREEIREAKMLPIRDGEKSFIGLFQGISGTLKSMDVSLNDVTLQQYQHAGEKGAEVACGTWMHFALPKDTGRDLRILAPDIAAEDLLEEFFTSQPELIQQDAADAGFREQQLYYDAAAAGQAAGAAAADGQTVAGQAAGGQAANGKAMTLPVGFASAVNDLFRKTPGKAALSLRGKNLDIFIKNRVLAPNYPVSTKPEENFLSTDPIPEFKDALALAKTL